MLGILSATTLLTAGPAHALDVGVRVATPEQVRAREGAHGLLVPGAGPTTSREAALAALVRGEVRNSLLEGPPEGDAAIELGGTGDVTVWVSLPPPGERPNDRRYPVAVVGDGWEGTLESPATRVRGLVSIADVAPAVQALERGGEPRLRVADEDVDLRALDRRIRDKNAARAPAMFLVAALVAVLAALRPRAGVAAIASLLLGNLVLGLAGASDTWVIVGGLALAGVAAVPWSRTAEIGILFALTVFTYLLALGINGEAVALSPLGPTQNARFYGLSNLLATLLLAAAVAGAGIVGRRFGPFVFAAVAGAAFAATALSGFGADGGGAVVLLVAFSVLATMLYGLRAAVLVALAIAAAFALDLLLGGDSHITRALDGGLLDDLARRLELSWERATGTWYEALYLASLFLALAAMAAWTWRRDPILLALAVALGVSLVVNDSPNEVLVPGVACYFALSSWLGRRDPREA